MKRIIYSIIKIALPENIIGDRVYFIIMFFVAHRRIPSRKSKLINDYLFYMKFDMKLFDILRQVTSDKFLVKDYINKNTNKLYSIETVDYISDGNDLNKIYYDFDVVLKPSHLSGSIIHLAKNEKLNSEQIKSLKKDLKRNLYNENREHNYRYLRPSIVIEPLLDNIDAMIDYKFFVYNNVVKFIQVDVARFKSHKRSIYLPDWTLTDIEYNYETADVLPRPDLLTEMLQVAQIVSMNFEFIRVDFYNIGRKLYIGELTHCPEQAHGRFRSIDEERKLSQIFFSAP